MLRKYYPYLLESIIVWFICFYVVNSVFLYFQNKWDELLAKIESERDVTEYIYYRGVQSQMDNFEIYKDIIFISDSVVFETVDVTWQDILRCDLYDWLWYRYYSYYESKARLEVKDYTSIWTWQWEKPTVESECFLDWLVVVKADNGDNKFLHVTSNVFTIWAK